jgi:hypothetical protein
MLPVSGNYVKLFLSENGNYFLGVKKPDVSGLLFNLCICCYLFGYISLLADCIVSNSGVMF